MFTFKIQPGNYHGFALSFICWKMQLITDKLVIDPLPASAT